MILDEIIEITLTSRNIGYYAEHLQGALFDYGKLRKITNKDLQFEEVVV